MRSWQRNKPLLWFGLFLSVVASAWCFYTFTFFVWAADFPKDTYRRLYATRAMEYLVVAMLLLISAGYLAFVALRGTRKTRS